jgi:hypothetical protein
VSEVVQVLNLPLGQITSRGPNRDLDTVEGGQSLEHRMNHALRVMQRELAVAIAELLSSIDDTHGTAARSR